MLQALILIGGKSKRMGSEKAWLDLHGKPQYDHMYQLLSDLQLPTYFACNKHQHSKIPESYHKIVDNYNDIGPMGGIVSALKSNRLADWLVIACDLFLIDIASINQLLDQYNSKADIITFKNDSTGIIETTCTIYKSETFTYFKEAIKSESYGLFSIVNKLETKYIMPNNPNCLLNVNTKEEFQLVKNILGSINKSNH